MTNWASVLIPAAAVPGGVFDVNTMLGSGGIFRSDVVLQEFITRFSPHAPAIVANRHARWCKMLDRAGGVPTLPPLLEKPTFQSTYPPTYLHYQSPIFDRLQSSYDDVNFEVDLMRSTAFHRHSGLIFLGGDGLTYMRLLSRLKQDPRRYLMTTPLVIPQLGEHPHGTHHVLHGGWRLWWPLLAVFAVVVDNKKQFKSINRTIGPRNGAPSPHSQPTLSHTTPDRTLLTRNTRGGKGKGRGGGGEG